MRVMIRKSVADEICRYWGFPLVLKAYNPRDPKFEYFKRKILAHLEKLERKEKAQMRKSLAYLERLEKAQKRNVGDIVTWGRKVKHEYIKGADGKWRRYYRGTSRGQKLSVAALRRKVDACKDTNELWDLVFANWGRFMDADKMPLPVVRELHAYASKREDEIKASAVVENRTSAKPRDVLAVQNKGLQESVKTKAELRQFFQQPLCYTIKSYDDLYYRDLISRAIEMYDLVGAPKPVVDRIGNIEKGEPMTFKQADDLSVNPRYYLDTYLDAKDKDGFATNCQTCVVVFIARLMGFDVVALPNKNNKVIEKLAAHGSSMLAFIDNKTGMPPKPVYPRCQNKEQIIEWMHKNLEPSKIYLVGHGWKEKEYGHIVVCWKEPAQNKEGHILKIYDPQPGDVYRGDDDLSDYFEDVKEKTVKFTDVSDCSLNEKVCSKIMEKW